jgi:hypothetical protein
MDPFSITVGIVGLADAGTNLAGWLTEKYKSYRDAPELLLEIAHEVEFCAGLVDMFGSSLDRPGVEHPKRFVRDAKVLVEKVGSMIIVAYLAYIERTSLTWIPDASNLQRDSDPDSS